MESSSQQPPPLSNDDDDGLRGSSYSTDDKHIILVSMEGEQYEMSLKAANRLSGMIQVAAGVGLDDDDCDDCDDCDDDDCDDCDESSAFNEDDEPKELVVNRIRGEVLSRVVEYCHHYVYDEPMPNIQPPFVTTELEQIVGTSSWYVNFVKGCTFEMLRELILAANYLDIKPLLDLCILGVAAEVKGKTADKVRPMFGIRKVFSITEEDDENNSNNNNNTATATATTTNNNNNNNNKATTTNQENLWCKQYMEATSTTLPPLSPPHSPSAT